MRILISLVTRFANLRDRWRNYWAIWWLRRRGVTVGENVYIGKKVRISLGKKTVLKIGANVTIKENTQLYLSDNASLSIGARTYVGFHCELSFTSNCTIGEDCQIAGYCTVIDSNHQFIDPTIPINKQGFVSAPIAIADDVWLGNKVVVLKGVQIGRHSVVGAGAVVTKDIPAFTVAAGVPARPIKQIGPDDKVKT